MRGSVTGLTSAATIWVVTAIGMAISASAYVEAVGASVLVMVVLAGMKQVVIDLTLRGPRRLHEQALIAVVHHPLVRSVSTGE